MRRAMSAPRNDMKLVRSLLVFMLISVVLLACGDAAPTEPDPEPDPPAPAALVRVSPDSVLLEVGEPTELVVRVLNEEGEPVEGARVRWRLGVGGNMVDATLVSAETLTDESGFARAIVRAGGRVGYHVISVGSPDIEASGFWFWLIMRPGPPAELRLVPDTAAVWLGETLQLEVDFRDRFGNPTEGGPVEWTASEPAVVSVDGDGLAEGHAPGRGSVTATSGELSATIPTAGVEWPRFVAVATAHSHTCAVTEDGEAFCWGVDGTRQEADPRRIRCARWLFGAPEEWCSPVPYRVPGHLAFRDLDASHRATCGVTDAGQAMCWGSGLVLGTGSAVAWSPQPVPAAPGLDVVTVGLGTSFACALDASRSAYCWGRGNLGQLGTGSFEDSPAPAPVGGGARFDTIAAGPGLACGLTPAGEAFCWGANRMGELGAGWTSDPGEAEPVRVAGEHTFASLQVASVACALTASGEAYCWGPGGSGYGSVYGRFGNDSVEDAIVPVRAAAGLRLNAIAVGSGHGCGIALDGRAYCWGLGDLGQLGTGSAQGSRTPVPVAGDLRFLTIDVGSAHTCGIDTRHRLYCWGSNEFGGLGDGSSPHASPYASGPIRPHRTVPTPISALPFVRAE
jgi:alpha-tubulin suppressor-like RCC1 family protein